MIVTVLFFAISLLLIIVLYVMICNNSVNYPIDGKNPTGKANLTYYYSRLSNEINVNPTQGKVFYQTVYSPLHKTCTINGTNHQIGSYSSATTIMGFNTNFINYTNSCISNPNYDCSGNLNTFNNLLFSKSGFAVLSISDSDISGTLTYVLNNTAFLKNNPNYVNGHGLPFYFPNKDGDVTVYDIVGGTGSFLGKKGYIYVDEISDTNIRTIKIYYK